MSLKKKSLKIVGLNDLWRPFQIKITLYLSNEAKNIRVLDYRFFSK